MRYDSDISQSVISNKRCLVYAICDNKSHGEQPADLEVSSAYDDTMHEDIFTFLCHTLSRLHPSSPVGEPPPFGTSTLEFCARRRCRHNCTRPTTGVWNLCLRPCVWSVFWLWPEGLTINCSCLRRDGSWPLFA